MKVLFWNDKAWLLSENKKMAGKSCSTRLFEITSEWFLDYCIYQLWKEFRDKRSFSSCWKDAVQDYLENKPFDIDQELSTKLQCIRFIIGLHQCRPVDVHSSQESSCSSSSEDENESRLLGCSCLKFFDKIAGIYPFSDVEKVHMRNTLKLQIVLSHFRQGGIKDAENLYFKLYSDEGDDEEYQDDIRELFQSENDTWKKAFLRKQTYDRFLNQVQQFFTPAWKKFEIPVLEEVPFLEDSNKESSRIDARTLKALYFAWDQTEESEQNWMSIVEGTHSDIIALKNKTNRRNTKGATSSSKEKSPSIRQLRQDTRSRGEPTSSKKTIASVNVERCDEVMRNLKSSSRNLFSGLKDAYSDMKAGKAGDSRANNDHNDDDDDDDDNINDFSIRRHCKPVVAIPDSPSRQKADKGKQPLERRSTKRRFNEKQSDAEIIDWDSDDDETLKKHKTIKLSSPARKRHLNIKLPVKTTRKFWTAEETKWLEEGVKVYGEGNWAKILKAYNFSGRTSVHLKDRWRNLQKNS